MILNMFLITAILLMTGIWWLPWWALLLLLGLLFLWWLYTLSPRYSIGGYSYLAPTKEKILALTFSGGDREKIEKVLSWLEEHDIPAVFFVYGRVAEENPIVIKRIFQAGHLLGIAGFEPKETWFSKHFESDDIHKIIHRTQEILAQIIPHFHTVLFRPYLGRKRIFNSWRLKHNFGYYVVLWSFTLGKSALHKIKSRMIINVVLDDISQDVLLSQLQTLKNYAQMHGYQFVQIEV